MTAQRRAILEDLRAVRSHPTAEEIYNSVRRRRPRISLGTVYRNLQVLAAAGDIQEVAASGPRRRFDGNPAPHEHVRCLCCERVADLPPLSTEEIEAEAGRATDFLILERRLEFVGLCPRCRQGKRAALP